MWNAGLDESQAGIKILGRNINNLRDADDTTQMSESKEELKSLLIRVREESEKSGLKLNIQKTKIMVPSGPITSWQTDEGKVEMVTDFLFLDSKITVNTVKKITAAMKLEDTSSLEEKLDSILKSRDITCWQRSI